MHRNGLLGLAFFGVVALLFLRLPPMVAKQDAMYNTYRALVEVDALAKQQFVEPIRGNRLVDGAIRGMLLQLDPYSGYISSEELAAFRRRNAGRYVGTGVAVGVRDGKLTIITPMDDSPASKAGILPGDIIAQVDGKDTEGMSVFDLDELLIGPAGSTVAVTVLHVGESEPRTLTITRGPVSITSVRGFGRNRNGDWDYLIDPDLAIGYIRVSNFHDQTFEDFDEALVDLLHRGMKGLVLDLRFNPGGLLDQAVTMVDRFVDSGVIVSTVTRRQAVREYRATQDGSLTYLPLAVLISGASASSAEIVAGALQDHGRATLVGERSFGKGSVQHLIELGMHEAAIKLTVAYYRLPSGRIIHRDRNRNKSDDWGVQPDIKITLGKNEVKSIQDARLILDRMNWDRSIEPAAPLLGNERAAGAHTPKNLVMDRQLAAALSVIRKQVAE